MILSGGKKLSCVKPRLVCVSQKWKAAARFLSTKATAPAFHYQPLFDLGADTTTEYKRLDKVHPNPVKQF